MIHYFFDKLTLMESKSTRTHSLVHCRLGPAFEMCENLMLSHAFPSSSVSSSKVKKWYVPLSDPPLSKWIIEILCGNPAALKDVKILVVQ